MADHNPGSGSADPARSATRLHDELFWDTSDPSRPVLIHGGEPIASFECLMPSERRVVTRLEFLGGQRSVDVGVQPDTIVHLLRRLAMLRNNNSDAWQRAVRRQLLAAATDWGITNSVEPGDSLGEVLAVLGFPLIEMARARGVQPPPYVPRWAEPVLVAPEPRAAARAVFGRRASRRVARSLAASLVGGAAGAAAEQRAEGQMAPTMVMVPLALAIALPPAASSDLIANVLEGAAAPHAAQHWPSVDQVEIIRRGFKLVGPQLSVRLCLEAMERLDGPALLSTLMVHMPRLLASHDRPCPQRLEPLAAAVAEFVNEPVELARQAPRAPRGVLPPLPVRAIERAARPVEPPQQVDQPAAPRVAAYHDGGGIDLPVQPLYAEGTARAVAPGDEFQYPTAVLRLHGATTGEHSLWLPRSRRELREWGAELSNCMADYCDHVANNRSVILGVRRRGRLVAGVELTRDLRRVRQFVRDGNQRPWRAERDALRELFGRLGVAGG